MKTRPMSPPVNTAPERGGFLRDMGSVMAQGMAFGAGSEIAHQAVRGLVGGDHYYHQPTVVQQQPSMESNYGQQQQMKNLCDFENTQFINCLKSNGDSISTCQNYFDMLKECQKKNF